MSKGSQRRPQQISDAELDQRWNLTFGHYGMSEAEQEIERRDQTEKRVNGHVAWCSDIDSEGHSDYLIKRCGADAESVTDA